MYGINIAVYKGNKYKLISNRRYKGIITRCSGNIDDSFFKEKDMYYKPIDERNLTEIYTVEFFVFFDTGFECVSPWWKITEADLMNNKVKLRFTEGILPNWSIEEKNVCTKDIAYKEISCAKVKFTFKKFHGEKVDMLTKEEIKNWNEILRSIYEYSSI